MHVFTHAGLPVYIVAYVHTLYGVYALDTALNTTTITNNSAKEGVTCTLHMTPCLLRIVIERRAGHGRVISAPSR